MAYCVKVLDSTKLLGTKDCANVVGHSTKLLSWNIDSTKLLDMEYCANVVDST